MEYNPFEGMESYIRALEDIVFDLRAMFKTLHPGGFTCSNSDMCLRCEEEKKLKEKLAQFDRDFQMEKI